MTGHPELVLRLRSGRSENPIVVSSSTNRSSRGSRRMNGCFLNPHPPPHLPLGCESYRLEGGGRIFHLSIDTRRKRLLAATGACTVGAARKGDYQFPSLVRREVSRIDPTPKPEGWSGEEVLERHLFKYEQTVASDYPWSAFLPRTVTYNLGVRILKLRNPDRPSGRCQFFHPFKE